MRFQIDDTVYRVWYYKNMVLSSVYKIVDIIDNEYKAVDYRGNLFTCNVRQNDLIRTREEALAKLEEYKKVANFEFDNDKNNNKEVKNVKETKNEQAVKQISSSISKPKISPIHYKKTIKRKYIYKDNCCNIVKIGSIVNIKFEDGEIDTYKFMQSIEKYSPFWIIGDYYDYKNTNLGKDIIYTPDSKYKTLFDNSPIGKEIIGKKVGDKCHVFVEGITTNFEIISIS